MGVLYGDPSHLLPLLNDVRENQTAFTQVIQSVNKAINDLKLWELGGIFQDPKPSRMLGIPIFNCVEALNGRHLHPGSQPQRRDRPQRSYSQQRVIQYPL